MSAFIIFLLSIAVYYIVRLLYYQKYERKVSYLVNSFKILKTGLDVSLISNEPVKIKQILVDIDNIKMLRPFNELMVKALSNTMNEPILMGLIALTESYIIEYKQRISNSLAAATLLTLLSTIISVLYKI